MPKLPPPTPVVQLFANHLNTLQTLEKKGFKLYAKFVKAAFTPELSKCLAPISTDMEKHMERIALIKLAKLAKPNTNSEITLNTKLRLKKASAEQDLRLIAEALNLQHQKLAYYELLHPMAIVLKLTTAAELIEQTVTDHRNTNTWLRQILQNIVAPTWHEN